MSLIFGINSKHSVAVVELKMNVVVIMYANVTRSESKLASTTTLTLVITTLYTLMPMYWESLSADILTCRVSQAM